jgi:hypothetical protein
MPIRIVDPMCYCNHCRCSRLQCFSSWGSLLQLSPFKLSVTERCEGSERNRLQSERLSEVVSEVWRQKVILAVIVKLFEGPFHFVTRGISLCNRMIVK